MVDHGLLTLAAPQSEAERVLAPFMGQEIASQWALEPWGWRGGEVPHPSPIIRDRSEPGDRLGELYDRMLRTPELAGLWRKRAKAVLQLPRRIEPADSTPQATEAADLVRRALSRSEEHTSELQS